MRDIRCGILVMALSSLAGCSFYFDTSTYLHRDHG